MSSESLVAEVRSLAGIFLAGAGNSKTFPAPVPTQWLATLNRMPPGARKLLLDEIPTGWYAPAMTKRRTPAKGKSAEAKAAKGEASAERLLDAAVHVIRSKGYSAARVEDICAEAGLTKGAFFHHFASKEVCAVAAAAHFAARAEAIFDAAPYMGLPDPRERALGYVDFRKAILQGDLPQFTCLLGTMVQEAYDTHPLIRQACDRYISEHAERLEADLGEAKALYAPEAGWTPGSAALFSQAVLQGAFVLAKARHGPKVAADCLDHLKRYFEGLMPVGKRSDAP